MYIYVQRDTSLHKAFMRPILICLSLKTNSNCIHLQYYWKSASLNYPRIHATITESVILWIKYTYVHKTCMSQTLNSFLKNIIILSETAQKQKCDISQNAQMEYVVAKWYTRIQYCLGLLVLVKH